jgi:hypothetical protein
MKKEEKTKKRRFNSIDHVKQFLAETINALKADLITEGKAHQLGYLCKILADLMESTDFEKRIAEIERRLNLS